MSILRFFKAFFAGSPHQVDYSTLPDEQLVQLWKERSQLTDDARESLRAEVEQRGLSPGEDEQRGLSPGEQEVERRTGSRSPRQPGSERSGPHGGGMTIGFGPDGSQSIEVGGAGGARIVLNEPRSDDDGRPRSRDGLDVARRLVMSLAARRSLEEPAFTFVDAALLMARAGDSLPRVVDRRRRTLAELCWAAASHDHERACAICDEDDELSFYRDALVVPFAPATVLSRAPGSLHAIVATAATDRELADRHLAELATGELADDLLVEATLVALDLDLDAEPFVRRWKHPDSSADDEVRHFWRAAEVRRIARTDLEAAVALEMELPVEWRHDDDASMAVAARLARTDPARAVERARNNRPDLDHMSWLRGCVRGGAPMTGDLVDEWIAELGPHTYDPYGYFRGLLQACIELGDVSRTRRCLEVAGATGWQVAHAARWVLAGADNRDELLDACLDRYDPGVVAGRAVERTGLPFAVGRVVIRPEWLDFSDPHPVETLSVVAALGTDSPAWEWSWLP